MRKRSPGSGNIGAALNSLSFSFLLNSPSFSSFLFAFFVFYFEFTISNEYQKKHLVVEYNPRAHSDVPTYKRIFSLFLHRVRQPESSPQGGVLTGKYAYMCTLIQYSSRLMIFINYITSIFAYYHGTKNVFINAMIFTTLHWSVNGNKSSLDLKPNDYYHPKRCSRLSKQDRVQSVRPPTYNF